MNRVQELKKGIINGISTCKYKKRMKHGGDEVGVKFGKKELLVMESS